MKYKKPQLLTTTTTTTIVISQLRYDILYRYINLIKELFISLISQGQSIGRKFLIHFN